MKIKALAIRGGQRIELGKFTVLVGPNNVGKSQTLRDINTKVTTGPSGRTTLVEVIELEKPSTYAEMFRGIQVLDHPIHIGQKLVRGIAANLTSGDEVSFSSGSFEQEFERSSDGSFLLGTIGRFQVAFLDASSRLTVASTTASYNPHTSAPQRLLQVLYSAGTESEEQLRNAFNSTFDMDIKLDYSALAALSLRVAREFEPIPDDPRQAYPIMSNYNELDSQGDGFRSFVGVVLSVLLSEGRIVLLDEPEAFLHPAQARKLGYWIATHAQTSMTQIIVATHNASFLSGILARDAPVDIYRLNRIEDNTIYNKITSEAVAQLTKSPLLSSQSILDAVFHKGVVVGEGDPDRTVYQTVALREFNNQNVLFVHAQGKQTVKKVVSLLREATIPVCAVVDIDILNSRDELEALLAALGNECDVASVLNLRQRISAFVDEQPDSVLLGNLRVETIQFLEQLDKNEHTLSGARSALLRIHASISKWAELKKQGIAALPSDLVQDAQTLFDEATRTGLFIVQSGELESWINVGSSQKKKWIVLALNELFEGRCPESLRQFVGDILVYLQETPVPRTASPTDTLSANQ